VDRDELSAAIIQEMGAVFMAALAEALPATRGMDLGRLERHLRQMLRPVMGQAVERIVALEATGAQESVACPACGGRMRRVDQARPRAVQGLVGDYTLRRAYDCCTGCRQGHVPLDARLGLGPGVLSPGLARVVCRASLESPFEVAVDQVAEAVGVVVSAEVARQTTERVGAVAEAQVQAAMTRAQQGQPPWASAQQGGVSKSSVLAVEVDGLYVHRDEGWHEMKVVSVAPLGPQCDVDPDTGRQRLRWGTASYGAGFEEAEDFWYRAYVEACRRGLGTVAVRTVVLLGDGAEWIWRQGRAFLALPGVELVEIIDLYHAYEYLWTVGNAVFGAQTPAAAAWVEPLKTRLYAEGSAPVQAAVATLAHTLGIPETEAEEAGAEESAAVTAVRRARAYLTTNAARLDYPAFVARQLPIGSGAVESAGKAVVQARTKGAGMRWSGAGAQAVVSLRTLQRSGRWDVFWQTQPQRTRLLLFPHARPTRTTPPSVAASPAPAARPTPRLAGSAADPPAPGVLRPASPPRPTPQQRPLLLPRSLSA
jgi:Uncharacterised protein family (UPF0236)